MDELLTIEAIRERYHELAVDTYDCLARNDAHKGFAVRTQINKLLGILIPMLRSREILNMKVNLYTMRNKLQTLPFSHKKTLKTDKLYELCHSLI